MFFCTKARFRANLIIERSRVICTKAKGWVKRVENRINDTGMYIIDQEYRIVNFNRSMGEMYPEVKVGDVCYKAVALREERCENCPLFMEDVLFYNELRKEWISANAAEMNYPGCGTCYNIQFKRKTSSGSSKREEMPLQKIDSYIAELKETLGQDCAIGAYCKQGAPIFFVNEQMLEMLTYDSVDELVDRTDGMVMNLIHPDDRKQVKRDSVKAQKLGDVYESSFRMLRKDGSWIWLVAKGKIVETDHGKWATVTVCTDISNFIKHHENIKQENKELLHKEMQSESIMLSIPGGYHRCGLGENYPFLYISDSFHEIVGWTKEEIEEKFDNKFINLVWPEDVHLFDNLVEQIEDHGQGNSIYRMKKKGGGFVWVQDSTMLVDLGKDSFYQCTLADISYYIKELEEAREKAEVSNRAKSTFLFNASHDIRTPMNAIQGFTQMLKKNPDDGEYVRNILEKIEASGDMLMKLLNDVLELSRIESGKDELNLAATNLHVLVERMDTMFKQEILNAGIVFEMENNILKPYVLCDELKLTQVGMNMLSNAKKFTPKGGKITFGINQRPCSEKGYGIYRFYVRDTGIGMSEEFQKRAFEQFERERTSTDSGVIGSGLGMSIIRKLVELMGGTCELESEQGKGTEIAATIKLSLTDNVERYRETNEEKSLELAGKRVLLVEDNDLNREIAHYVLEGMGILMEDAENGSVAVNKLISSQEGYYDFVLMDIQMPIMDGYVATYEIRHFSNEKIAEIPIIAMTANAFQEDRARCLEAGMNGHVAKPIDKDALVKEIAKVLQ